ncbi:kinase-like protein [Heliocybe sulcata]|uniref:Kinase-like protein n=1 Tax=Heliocybe sulcata TaxID=5364 RepID=A0A5C3N4M1_9AGAM|nr:kinase-like protein [Heliocybe sulcata]
MSSYFPGGSGLGWQRSLDRIKRKLETLVASVWRVTLSRWFFVKRARNADVECATMRFVAANTSIPVPRVRFQFRWDDRTYIVMDRVRGRPLADIWRELPEAAKEIVVVRLAEYMKQLRSIPPPPGTSICSVLGGPVYCWRLNQWEPLTGPFRDEEHMNLQLRTLQPVDSCAEVVKTAHAKTHPLVFTHNDFVTRNIMAQEDGTITGIIDWECAGWFPAHWEYCKTMNWGNWHPQNREWYPWVHRFLPAYELEAEADRALLQQFFAPEFHAP